MGEKDEEEDDDSGASGSDRRARESVRAQVRRSASSRVLRHSNAVPSTIRKNLEAIGALDDASRGLCGALDAALARLQDERAQFAAASAAAAASTARGGGSTNGPTPPQQQQLQTMEAMHTLTMELARRKAELAAQTYDLVDTQIRFLDSEILIAEELMRQSGVDPMEILQEIVDQSAAEVAGKAAAARAHRNAQKQSGGESIAHLVDPNEPVYCVCRQIAYGDMIACDNPDCEIEWYHVGCLGLSRMPVGQWLCPACTAKKKRQRALS